MRSVRSREQAKQAQSHEMNQMTCPVILLHASKMFARGHEISEAGIGKESVKNDYG